VGDLPTTCESNYLVSVTNLNREDEKVSNAGFGARNIDLGAYGEQAYTIFSSSYGGFGGTSSATPHVAGTAALLYSANCPNFISLTKSDPAQAALVVKDCILYGVKHNQSLEGITVTEGGLNAFNAMENLMSTCENCFPAFGSDVIETTDQSGIFTWFENGSSGVTSLRYKVLDDPDWIEVGNVESGYNLENLNFCSYYEFQTKTICDNDPEADYSYSRVFKTDGCCEIPSGIKIMTTEENLTVQWNTVLSATNFVIEWRNVVDTSWTSVNLGTENSFVIESSSDCEFFEVRIKSECDNTNNESVFTNVIKLNTDCDGCTKDFCPIDDKIIDDEWVESVEIVDVFSNISGANINGYGLFLGQFDIELTASEEYTIILTPGHSSLKYLEFFSVYIDYNQNGEFEEDEDIFISSEGSSEQVMGPFTVPIYALDGYARMRVVMRYDELNGPCDVIGFNFGEVEEYCVYINGNKDCPLDIVADIIDTTLTSLTFEFVPSNNVDAYLVAYKEKGTTEFDTLSSTSNNMEISELEICTAYEYKLGHLCQNEITFNDELEEIITLCEVGTANIDILSFHIYPNPTFGDLIVQFDMPIHEEIKIELLTTVGKSIRLNNMIKEGEKLLIIDTQEIPSGVYILKANFENRIVAKKWVKY
jgi:hypothetical protein